MMGHWRLNSSWKAAPHAPLSLSLFLPIKAGNGMKVGHELMKQFLSVAIGVMLGNNGSFKP
jgi:hypothetical protein